MGQARTMAVAVCVCLCLCLCVFRCLVLNPGPGDLKGSFTSQISCHPITDCSLPRDQRRKMEGRSDMDGATVKCQQRQRAHLYTL